MSHCLGLLGLQEFGAQLVNHGFDRLHDILSLDDDDFAMLISDEEIKAKYKTALHQGKTSQFTLILIKTRESSTSFLKQQCLTISL